MAKDITPVGTIAGGLCDPKCSPSAMWHSHGAAVLQPLARRCAIANFATVANLRREFEGIC